jgi:hypothetical protein
MANRKEKKTKEDKGNHRYTNILKNKKEGEGEACIHFLILNQSRYMGAQGFCAFTGCASPINDIGGVDSLFQ